MSGNIPNTGLTRSSLRRILGEILRTDSDLNAFCLDHFPKVAERYTEGMDRLAKINLLISCNRAEQIFTQLMRAFPDSVAPNLSDKKANSNNRQSRKHRNRLRMLAKVRKFWIEDIFEYSMQGRKLIELKKEICREEAFQPWNSILCRPQQLSSTVPDNQRMINLFDDNLGRILILGAPGAGKTTMLIDLCQHLLMS